MTLQAMRSGSLNVYLSLDGPWASVGLFPLQAFLLHNL